MKTKRLLILFAVILLSVATAVAKDFRTVVFKVDQLHCESCERKVQNNIKFEKGVKNFTIRLKEKTVAITYDTEKTNIKKLQAAFKKFKYEAVFVKETAEEEEKK